MSEAIAANEAPTTTGSGRSAAGEAAIRKLMDEWTNALRARDIARLMSFYAQDAVFFDGIAPLQVTPDRFRANWEEFFQWFPGPVNFETRNLKITAGDHSGFATSLVYLMGTNAEGKEDGTWMRQTIGYEKVNGTWRITHEHWSMPMDMETGKVVTNLKPE